MILFWNYWAFLIDVRGKFVILLPSDICMVLSVYYKVLSSFVLWTKNSESLLWMSLKEVWETKGFGYPLSMSTNLPRFVLNFWLSEIWTSVLYKIHQKSVFIVRYYRKPYQIFLRNFHEISNPCSPTLVSTFELNIILDSPDKTLKLIKS